MTLSAFQVRGGVSRLGLLQTVQSPVSSSLWSDPLPRGLRGSGHSVRGGGSVVVLLLMNGDVETLHARVKGVGPNCDSHRLTTGDQTATRLMLLFVLHCHHINLLFILLLFIVII